MLPLFSVEGDDELMGLMKVVSSGCIVCIQASSCARGVLRVCVLGEKCAEPSALQCLHSFAFPQLAVSLSYSELPRDAVTVFMGFMRTVRETKKLVYSLLMQ